ncbi:MAG: hypothetical protein ACI8RD_010525 [Bacillariaceae sp.]|jgi:hypothetical protein
MIQHSNSLIRNTRRINFGPRIINPSTSSLIRNVITNYPSSSLRSSSSGQQTGKYRYHDRKRMINNDDKSNKTTRRNRNNNKNKNTVYNGRDFRTYEEQQRLQLEWMVRNTAKVIGEQKEEIMSPHLIKITHSLMQAWAKRAAVMKSSKAPHVVEALLQRLLTEKKVLDNNNKGGGRDGGNRKNQVEIYIDDYNAVLEGWSHSREPGSANRAEEILLKMEQEEGTKPNCRSYTAVIKALVKNGDRDTAVGKVEEIIMKMEATCDPNILPNQRSYNLLLYALANSNQDDAAERATQHLERMLHRYRQNTPEENNICLIQPDTNSFNQVIGAWARGKASNHLVGMEKIYNLLLELSNELDIEPDVDTFNLVMGGWLKSDDSSEALLQIQQTMSTMEGSFKSGNRSARPDTFSFNTLQSALKKYSQGENTTSSSSSSSRNYLYDKDKQLRLENEYGIPRTSFSQNILMDSIIKTGVDDAPEQVLEILIEMENSFKMGQIDMKTDQCSYKTVIGAYIKYGRDNIEEVTEDILALMWDLHRNHGGNAPDTTVYNCVINAYASIKSSHALEKVKNILEQMENGEKEDPKPNLITYNTVIKAMRNGSKKEGAAFAEDILTKLECMGRKDPHFLPDNYSYTSVITAYGRSNSSKKAEKALEIINRMIEGQKSDKKAATVTSQSFNAALNACAFVGGSEEAKTRAFEIATKIDKLRLKSGEVPDSTWYGTMLRACSSLVQPSEYREKLVERFFQEACENGCVGRLVIKQLKFAATPDNQMRLLGRKYGRREFVHLDELPKAWTKNAREWQ